MEGKSMAKSLSDSKIFSLRIVSIDYYMAPPIPNIDICYSSFQGGKVNEVPVIRVYGSTPAGQKTCLHVHRAFPYLYVPCSDIPLKLVQEGDSYTNAIALALEKALKLKSNAASKRQHVHGCSLVRARKFYGYHSSEELFVKIYLYYPNDVSRAANLLLAGAVLDKSLQPHESHIPYLLQFLIDYNLYGMGHVHLSKIKFRHPVPDVCMLRKFNCNSQHALEICTSADFEAGSSGSKSLDSPIWVSYTIPGDWMWQFSSEYETLSDQCIDHIKRQSICELEGDAIVDEILNQQCKTYTPLSQTSSDVKMVQSLIPIWEEEYERTGVHEAVILPVPGKPLAEDVLRTLSHDLEFQRKCMEFYCISEENLLSIGNNVKYQKSLMSSTSKEDLAEIGNVNSDNNNEEPLKSSAEKDIIGSSSSFGSLHAEEMDAAPPKKKDACPELLCLSDVQSSEIIGTLNPKIADAEALGLLRWLATSQAAEDINSDDELVRETILSPLLPATTIDKVLEKANIDYESESQKECQDILDSVEDLTDFESLKDKAFHSTDTNRDQTPSKIPQGDAVLSSTSTSSGSSSKVEMKSDFKRHFEQQVIQSNRSCISNNGKRKKSLWGSLPFSPTEKGTDHRESTRSHIADAHGGEGKNSVSTSMAGNEEGKHSDAQAKNSDVNVCGVGDLVWCSVRDLMRKKRCCRIVHQNCGNAGVKIVRSGKENEQDNIHLPNKFDLHAPHDDKHAKIPLGCVNFSSCSTNKQIKYPEVHVSGFDHPHCHIYMEAPYASSRDSPLQDENCYATKHEGDSGFSLLDSSIPAVASMEGGPGGLISMIFSKKPPIMDWKNRASEKASFSPALLFHPSFVNEDKHGTSGNALDEILPFFEGESQENIVFQNTYLPDSDSNVQQEAIIGVPTHYQNDGSLLFLLTPVYSPPSSNSVYRWLACDNKGTPQEIDMLSVEPLSIKGSSETGPQGSSPVCGDNISMESGSVSHLIPMQDQSQQDIRQNVDSELHPKHDKVQRLLNGKENNAKLYAGSDCSVDLSQISGPNGSSRPTPLSQIGFRDPASIGAGQQLTLLSIEVLAESRGDLRPDPRFDAINVVALAFQNDNDSAVEVYVLLHGNTESCRRNSDGISVNKVHYFSDEKHLFSHFIGIMSSYDPDIIIGWDIQGGSLGFLAERAAHIGMGFLNKISRTPIELNIGYIETEISNKGALDSVLHESSLADSVLVEQAIIEDEWGRTHASGVHVGGRVVLNLWRLMRSEVKLNMYTIGAVGEAVLRRKIPSIPHKVLTRWFSSGPGRARYRCIEYIIQQAKLNLEIINHLDMINRTSELARVFGIDFFSVLSRGSQYRVESMFLRLAHSQNYLAISPGKQQVASQPAMECLPLVMEPESGFYADPVVVLDFQSLYPSMIIAYNLCFSTCLGNVARWKENSLGVCSFSPEQHVLRDLKDKFLLTPNSILYVPPKVRKGILPRLLEEILSTRIMVKKAMKKLTPAQQVLHRIFNARQLALKLIANVTYGYTAAGFSGRMPCAELADSIVQCGRSTLEKAISLVNANDKWNARVIYGDTDSMFVLLKGRSVKESFQIGHEIASAVTAMNPDPVTLKMEKVYHPCFLLTKKRYVGYSYESVEQTEPVFDAKGIETVRRDTCGAVAKMMEQSLRLFFERQDISEIKGYLQRQWTRILSGRVSLQDFVFAKEVRLGTYSARTSSSLPPAAIVATKAMRADPRAEPCYAERVPYVVIHGEPGAHLFDMVVDPLDLLAIDSPYRLNDIYYINKQIIPALQRVFGLLGVDLKQWFLEMPRPGRDAFSKRPSCALNPQRTRIDFYYLSKHCMLCGELVHASTHICKNCSEKETAAATAVIGRTSKLEKEMQHLSAICRHCGGGDWILESGVKCISLACSVFYERRKVQKELQGLSYVAADKGFHPKCMVEWF